MSAKAILVFCAQALLAHVAYSQCVYHKSDYIGALHAPSNPAASCGALGGNGLSYGSSSVGYGARRGIGCGHGYAGTGLNAANIEVTPTSGGSLPVCSTSSIAPTGLSIASENTFEGSLHVVGELPFVSATDLKAVLPSAGVGAINYGCGNGVTAITSDAGYSAGAYGLGTAGIASAAAGYGSGVAAIAPAAAGVAGHECGCAGY